MIKESNLLKVQKMIFLHLFYSHFSWRKNRSINEIAI